MWATAVTALIVPKDVAATWALQRLPVAHRDVLERARTEYLMAEKQDWTALRAEVGTAVAYLRDAVERALGRCGPAGELSAF